MGVRAWVAAGLLAAGAVLLAGPSGAATTEVACGDVAGLSAAVLQAGTNGQPDEVVLAGDCTYLLTSTLRVQPDGGQPLVLRGRPGTVLDGGGAVRLVEVTAGAVARLERLELRRGLAAFEINQLRGGAVRNLGTVTLVDSTVADSGGGRVGGGLDNSGTAVVERSLFVGNTATTAGAGITNVGAMTVVSSTVTGSDSSSAVYAEQPMRVVGSTIAGNPAAGLEVARTLTLVNSVVADNAGGDCIRLLGADGPARVLDGSGNVVDGGGCALQDGSRSGTDPRLLPLADRGGPTRTFGLGAGSPALEAANTTICTTPVADGGQGGVDQRGVARPQSGRCDAGAVESAASLDLPAAVDLGTADAGTPLQRTVTLAAAGPDASVLGEVVASGAFTVADDGCSGRTLPAGEACAVVVDTVAADGRNDGTLTVVDNAGSAPRVVALSATGVTPVAAPADSPASTPAPGPGAADPTPAAPPPAAPVPSAPAPDAPPPSTPAAAPGAPPSSAQAPTSTGTTPRDVVLAQDATTEPPARSSFTSAVPTFDEVSFSPGHVAANALWALGLLLLLALPTTIVNSTLEAHRDELAAGWLRLRQRWRTPTVERWPSWVSGLASTALGVALYAFLDPELTPGRAAAALLLGLLLGSLALTAVAEGVGALELWRRLRVPSSLRLFPGFCLLALACVVLSRLTGLQPGLLLGTLAALHVGTALGARDLGRATGTAYAAVLAVSAYAYACWQPVAAAASSSDPSLTVLVTDAALVTVFLGGVQAVAFGLVPLSFLDGPVVRGWSTPLWAGLLFVGCFALVHLVLHPADGATAFAGRERYLLTVIGAYLLGSLAFWAAFRYRRRPAVA